MAVKVAKKRIKMGKFMGIENAPHIHSLQYMMYMLSGKNMIQESRIDTLEVRHHTIFRAIERRFIFVQAMATRNRACR